MVLDHDMVSDSSYSGGPNGFPNFSFAFNDSNFSDRLLRIEIIPGLHGIRSEGDVSNSIADWMRDRKRRREDINKDGAVEMNQKMADFAEDGEGDIMFSRDEEAMPMVEESPIAVRMLSTPAVNESVSGQGACSWSMDCYTVLRVRAIHVSSAILAAKSPFFYKLFSNGMRESEQRDVTIRISSSEEEAFMDLLNFMYSGRINACTATALLDVLMVADKFEVACCMRHCCSVLQSPSMTPESALLYLELPSTVLMADAVQSLTDAAKQFLAQRFRDVTKFQEEIMNLPLVGIEAVLSSNELQVSSEDVVFDFVIKWARQHYPKLEERKEILAHRLGHLIRFPNMSSRKLRKVLTCNDLDRDYASKVVLEALLFKDETPHRQKIMASEGTFRKRFCERAYKYRPVKVVEFDTPHQQCVVFMDLKKDECSALFPSGRLYSQGFNLGGQAFFLSAHCNMDQQTAFYCFGLYLGMQEKSAVGSTVEYEFATRSKPSCDFSVKYKGNYKFTGGKAVGYRNLFGLPWSAFIADDSPYFIHNILHLRAELTLKP